ncbi:Gak [Symbiodinium pilosum]|uniref:non-specific serine/threonine protein kinase n=1 Tax=Symbiodinium pilosum TaxID=2952 RepID=A0A812ILA9_SYMPI|nr:Gak [Symbiodinium pilosum]
MAWLWGAAASGSLTIEGREVVQETLIADGGFAYVYRGREVRTGEPLAIRRALLQDSEAHQAARLELSLLRRLPHHLHVVRFLGGEILEGGSGAASSKTQAVSLFELCTGGTLFSRLDSVVDKAHENAGLPAEKCVCPCLPEEEVLAVLGAGAGALAHLHHHRMIHYDVKSENLMLGADGLWKLGDFGSASERTFDFSGAPRKLVLEAEEFVHGRCTSIYRAPEVADVHLRWPIGPKADVFALGCVLYACLAGVHPFPMDSLLANIQARFHLPAAAETAYSADVIRWLHGSLRRAPEERPAAAVIAAEVAEFVSTGRVTSREPAKEDEAPPSVEPEWVADFSHMPPVAGHEADAEALSIAAATDKAVADTTASVTVDVPAELEQGPTAEAAPTLDTSEGDVPDEGTHPLPNQSSMGLTRPALQSESKWKSEVRVSSSAAQPTQGKPARARRSFPCFCASVRTRD